MTPTIADAADAYVWGYPLLVMHRTRALLGSRTELGTMRHSLDLADARSRAVVAPNNDTLYSSGWFDLSAGDLVIDVPPMDSPDRYWNVMVLDAFTHVTYASRRTQGTDGCSVRVTLDPESAPVEGDVLTMATPTVWVLVRVLVDGADDLPAARALQQAIVVHTPERHPRGHTEPLGRPNRVHEAGAAAFDELAAALAIDGVPAWQPQPSVAALAVARGDHHLTDADLAAAVAVGEERMGGFGLSSNVAANGWGTRKEGSDFADGVVLRAWCAKYVLAGHHPVENRSYVANHDDTGAPLDGGVRVTLTFPADGLPPCAGFWSLTVYQPDMFFFDNPLGRYSLGDRSVVPDDDGSVTISIGGPQPSDVKNWLPAPDGPYRMGLRVYEGSPEVVDATWFPPALVRGRLQ